MKSHLARALVLVAVPVFLCAGHPPSTAKQLEHEKAAASLPQECAGADLDQLGKPVMVKAGNGLLLGLSVGTKRIVHGDKVPLYLWIVNPTHKPLSFMSCGLEWFLKEGFVVYDANQDRVLTLEEQKNPRYRRPARSCLGSWSCDGNVFLNYAAHTCSKPEHAYDLRESYDLAPGKYVLAVPLDITSCAQQLGESQSECTKPDRAYDVRELYDLTSGKYVVAAPLDITSCAQQLGESQSETVRIGRISILIEPK